MKRATTNLTLHPLPPSLPPFYPKKLKIIPSFLSVYPSPPLLYLEGQGVGVLPNPLLYVFVPMSTMGSKFLLVFLMLATAMVAESTTSMHDADHLWGGLSTLGHDNNGFDFMSTEMVMDSEINHRLLAQKTRYISYGALRANSVPCNRRGSSYYNCNQRQKANPYRRGCSTITRCQRYTH